MGRDINPTYALNLCINVILCKLNPYTAGENVKLSWF
jgi:hypothetical protein